jgi:DNA-binding NtrC family response regulator
MNELEVKPSISETLPDSQRTADQPEGASEMVHHHFAPAEARVTLRSLRAETEMQAISQALQQTGWNRKRAAQLLSISYRGLLYKIRQHNITKNQDGRGVPKQPQMADTLSTWEAPDLAVAGGGTSGKD